MLPRSKSIKSLDQRSHGLTACIRIISITPSSDLPLVLRLRVREMNTRQEYTTKPFQSEKAEVVIDEGFDHDCVHPYPQFQILVCHSLGENEDEVLEHQTFQIHQSGLRAYLRTHSATEGPQRSDNKSWPKSTIHLESRYLQSHDDVAEVNNLMIDALKKSDLLKPGPSFDQAGH